MELDSDWYPTNNKGKFRSLENPKHQKLHDTVIKFMKEQDITCEETIYQTDRVIENAYEFIEELFKIVKEDLELEDDD